MFAGEKNARATQTHHPRKGRAILSPPDWWCLTIDLWQVVLERDGQSSKVQYYISN